MPDPIPKPSAQRRRRNKVPGAAKLPVDAAASTPRRKTPALGLRKVTKRTREWWKTIWASPMAAVWLDADIPGLVRLAELVDIANRGAATGVVLSEIRQLEDRFGLSPLARRRLQWELEQGAGGKPEEPDVPEEDGRWLRLVEGSS